MTEPTFAIIGASLAGASAAIELRKHGFEGRLIIIGKEPHLPYERPPLSKGYLRSEQGFEKSLVKDASFYEENEIETRLGDAATGIDTQDRVVQLDDGTSIPWDKLLIATGGRISRPTISGIESDWVFGLRTVEDSDAIKAKIAQGVAVAVAGMGFIGSEVAASLRSSGLHVTSIDDSSVPLEHVLGAQVGRVVGETHAAHGVEMISNDPVASFETEGSSHRVVTKSGRVVECDFAVIGLGIAPATDIVEGTGIEVDNGIVVDEHCRTSVVGVFAAGDVANHFHPLFGRRMRVEHWQNAIKQGEAAARNMLGRNDPYDDLHWFWSDQYEMSIQYAGYHTEWDELLVRGSIDDADFVVFYMKEGIVQAAASINRNRDLRRAMRIIKSKARVAPSLLTDNDVDLRELVPAEQSTRAST